MAIQTHPPPPIKDVSPSERPEAWVRRPLDHHATLAMTAVRAHSFSVTSAGAPRSGMMACGGPHVHSPPGARSGAMVTLVFAAALIAAILCFVIFLDERLDHALRQDRGEGRGQDGGCGREQPGSRSPARRASPTSRNCSARSPPRSRPLRRPGRRSRASPPRSSSSASPPGRPAPARRRQRRIAGSPRARRDRQRRQGARRHRRRFAPDRGGEAAPPLTALTHGPPPPHYGDTPVFTKSLLPPSCRHDPHRAHRPPRRPASRHAARQSARAGFLSRRRLRALSRLARQSCASLASRSGPIARCPTTSI